MIGKSGIKRRMGALLAAGLIAALPALPLRAQESQESPAATPPPVQLKSESTAVWLSVVGGLVPLGLALVMFGQTDDDVGAAFGYPILASMAVGPYLGYSYAGLSGRGLKGIGVRLIGLAGMIGGIILGFGEGLSPLGLPLMVGGCGVYLLSTIYDIAKIRQAVRERNSRLQKASLNIVPILAPKSRTIGLSLQLGF